MKFWKILTLSLALILMLAPISALAESGQVTVNGTGIVTLKPDTATIILGVSERTVNFHVGNACGKLGVYNRRAAVAQALKHGLLPSFIS